MMPSQSCHHTLIRASFVEEMVRVNTRDSSGVGLTRDVIVSCVESLAEQLLIALTSSLHLITA